MDAMLFQVVTIFLISALGSAIQSITGFGFAMLAIPLFSIFMPLHESIIIISISAAVLSIIILIKMRSVIDWRFILPVVISIFGGQFLGTVVLLFIDKNILKLILGLTLILISSVMFITGNRIVVKKSCANTIFCGFVSGLLGGMLGISGPPLVIYYYSVYSDKYEYQSSLQLTLLFICLFTLVFHAFAGNITVGIMTRSISGLLGVLIGSMIGLSVFKKVQKEAMRIPVYFIILCLGLWNVIDIMIP